MTPLVKSHRVLNRLLEHGSLGTRPSHAERGSGSETRNMGHMAMPRSGFSECIIVTYAYYEAGNKSCIKEL